MTFTLFGKVSVFWTNVLANTESRENLEGLFYLKMLQFYPMQMMQICFSIGRWWNWRVAFELIKIHFKGLFRKQINVCLVVLMLVLEWSGFMHLCKKNVRWFSPFVSLDTVLPDQTIGQTKLFEKLNKSLDFGFFFGHCRRRENVFSVQ